MNPEDQTSLFFNSLLHSIILFSILSALYILVILKMVQNGFRTQISNSVKKGMDPVLNNLSESDMLQLKLLPFDKLQLLYSRTSPDIQVYNDWLTKVVYIVVVGLLVIFILGCILLYFTCGQVVPLLHIITENIVVFAFVGSFEFLFFMYIASKYVPIKPSLLSSTFFEELKNSWT